MGTCIPLPPPAKEMTLCESCTNCINDVQAIASRFASNMSLTAAALGDGLYSWCSSANHTLSLCRDLQAGVANSWNGNLGRRAGAICSRLQLCDVTLIGSSNCSVQLADNQTGSLSVCTVEGIAGGSKVNGTYDGTGKCRVYSAALKQHTLV